MSFLGNLDFEDEQFTLMEYNFSAHINARNSSHGAVLSRVLGGKITCKIISDSQLAFHEKFFLCSVIEELVFTFYGANNQSALKTITAKEAVITSLVDEFRSSGSSPFILTLTISAKKILHESNSLSVEYNPKV